MSEQNEKNFPNDRYKIVLYMYIINKDGNIICLLVCHRSNMSIIPISDASVFVYVCIYGMFYFMVHCFIKN